MYQIHSTSFEQLASSDERIFQATQNLNIQKFYVLPTECVLCVVCGFYTIKTVNISLYSINSWVL